MKKQQPPAFDLKNVIMAMALSMLIIFGWQYYYAGPQAKKAEELANQQKTKVELNQTATPAVAAPVDHATAIAASPRIPIKTSQFDGSINLKGAELDDLHLIKYRELADPNSPAVTLLSPDGTTNAYFVEQGFVPVKGDTSKLPDSSTVWEAPVGAELTAEKPVTLTWDNGAGLKFERTISITDDYLFNVSQKVTNSGTAPVSLIPYARVQRQDQPVIAGYWVFFEGLLGVQNNGLEEHHYSDLKKAPDKPITVDSIGGWLGFTDKYWSTILIPDKAQKITANYRYVPAGARDAWQADYLSAEPLIIAPGTTATYEDRIFSGAKIVSSINAIEAKYGFEHFDLMIDWGWFRPLTKGMFYLLSFVHGIVGNFGIAILIVTVLVKAAVFPLASRSYASMSKMKKLKPEMDAIKAKYPDDRAKVQQETMELYKREKVSPLAGCLPMFVQIPVFFSLYKVILTTIELRHAPFFGWIHDLSAPDPTSLFNLFGLIPWTPPHALMIGFWPLIMGVTMWVQMRLNPEPTDPVQAQMFNWMPVMFTFMLGGFPAGLVIYWCWSNTLSVIQQSYIMKKNGADVNVLGNIRNSIPFLKPKPKGA